MIDDDTPGGGDDAQGVPLDLVAVAEADTPVTNDDVVGGDDEGVAAEADAVSGGGVACQGQKRLANDQEEGWQGRSCRRR